MLETVPQREKTELHLLKVFNIIDRAFRNKQVLNILLRLGA